MYRHIEMSTNVTDMHDRNHKLMNIVSTARHTPYAGAARILLQSLQWKFEIKSFVVKFRC